VLVKDYPVSEQARPMKDNAGEMEIFKQLGGTADTTTLHADFLIPLHGQNAVPAS